MEESSIDWLPPKPGPEIKQTLNPGMCPDWESNLQPFGYGTTFQPTEPQGPEQKFLTMFEQRAVQIMQLILAIISTHLLCVLVGYR